MLFTHLIKVTARPSKGRCVGLQADHALRYGFVTTEKFSFAIMARGFARRIWRALPSMATIDKIINREKIRSSVFMATTAKFDDYRRRIPTNIKLAGNPRREARFL